MKILIFTSIGIILVNIIIASSLEIFFMFYNPYNIEKRWNYIEEEVGSTNFNGTRLQGQLNAMGLRDKEYPFEHNTYRILSIGDSFTYGFLLKNCNSWPKKTETYVRNDGYTSVEIINGGIPGFNTKQEYEFFAKTTYRFNPDMIIIGFVINDATTLCSNCGAVTLKQKFDEQIASTKNMFGLYTINYIKLTALQRKLTETTINEYSEPYEKESKEFQQCKEALLKFKAMSITNHFKLVVVIYPVLCQLNEKYPFQQIHQKMLIFFNQSEIEAYDLTPTFYGYKDVELWVSSEDSHPNTKANEIASKKIANIIEGHLKN